MAKGITGLNREALQIFVLLTALTSLAFSVSSAPPKQQADSEEESPTVTLSFGQTLGRVGEEAAFPINMTATANIREPFKVVLRFPPSKLEYIKLGTGPLMRRYGWEVEPDLRTSPAAFDMSFLEISVQPGQGDFFPEGGQLALAYFKVLEAIEDHFIQLYPSVKFESGKPLTVKVEPAEILARPEAMFACFFYMH